MVMSTPKMTTANTAVLYARGTVIRYASWPVILLAETWKPERLSMNRKGTS